MLCPIPFPPVSKWCQLQIGACQGHLPSVSEEIESNPAAAVDLQHTLKGVQGGEWGALCSKETGGTDLQITSHFQELISGFQSLHLLITKWSESRSVMSNCLQPHGLCDPMDPMDSILAWILQVAFPFSRESSQPTNQTQVSRFAGRFFTSWATREAQEYWNG